MSRRLVYMGTPEFACPALEQLTIVPDVELALVVTQPDREAGRGRRLTAPPVRLAAERLGLPVYQTSSLRTVEQRQPIVDARPDLIVVAAFGLILGRSILELPRYGCVNLHASLLPRYRGASPIPAAILNGDRDTGVTLMRMEGGLDTGPTYAQSSIDITPDHTTTMLTGQLAIIAGELLLANLADLLTGEMTAIPQPGGASVTRPLGKADGWIDWTQPADRIERHVRAMWSWPRAWTAMPDGSTFQIHQASIADWYDAEIPGGVVGDRNGLRVRCGDGWLSIETGQVAGGKPLRGAQLASNQVFRDGVVLGQSGRPPVPGPMIRMID